MHRLVFCEPSTQVPNDPSEIFVEGDVFLVNHKMYQLILAGPIIYQKPTQKTFQTQQAPLPIGYVFGPTFPKSEYRSIGSHGNDVAQTGLIDIDMYSGHVDYSKLLDSYYPDYDWNNRIALRRLRKVAPEILWLGYTFGGDVGASYYAHYDHRNMIDSLMVMMDEE